MAQQPRYLLELAAPQLRARHGLRQALHAALLAEVAPAELREPVLGLQLQEVDALAVEQLA
eukprot:CAMPEP_0168396504 /NCGR_PEP_ID=MMETSP0228-20121227/20584_1 /TAXON_ID=133427 /ORGANISM="Protoceratium reticulatum, Strain CCCM 535 (=CCMP 1889)" /LENGTH=60 /DNA_ID=CAMNT_0008409951 /DNA_START=375 /DNA_END=554 /DNA_ORIENTATION=+